MSWFSRLSDSLEVEPSAQMPSQMLLSQAFPSDTAVFLEENVLCVHCVRQGRQGGNVVTVNFIPHCTRQLRRTVMLSGTCHVMNGEGIVESRNVRNRRGSYRRRL